LKNNWTALIVPIAILVTWDLLVRFSVVPNTLVASPWATVTDLFTMLKDGTLEKHALISTTRLLLGFSLGTLLGIIFGALISMNQTMAKLFEPTIALLAPIPAIAWVPLLIMFFGIGETSKVLLIAFGTFFVVCIHVVTGIRSTSREFIELATVLRKGPWDLFCFVLFPSALPEIFVGLRVAMGLSWTLLLVSEIIASSEGLGWLIWDARNFSRPDDLFVGMIAVGVLGRLSDILLLAIEKVSTRWRSTYGSWQHG
jgi:ABC-type nitrate/sulfonate/bicarbonate transport system permease component